MPTDSPTKRRIRRLKRERSKAFQLVRYLMSQRETDRLINRQMQAELEKYTKPESSETPPADPDYTMKVVDEPTEEPAVDVTADGQGV